MRFSTVVAVGVLLLFFGVLSIGLMTLIAPDDMNAIWADLSDIYTGWDNAFHPQRAR